MAENFCFWNNFIDLGFAPAFIQRAPDEADGLVDVDIFCKRGDDVLMPGTATVALPRRSAT